ncbi:MAG: saccharopine dehydrogenase NADP-binding domain-containing protein [Chloroflexi bacterium]|nr:saccharopine dehydrogenase NADP-binding domain-containing protein [Chloroflexota bacterium]
MGSFRYAVVGAGRQGAAAAYDMAVHGDAADVLVLDANPERAADVAGRVSRLTGHPSVGSGALDARDGEALVKALEPIDVFLCATPFSLILDCTRAAIASRTSMVDLGGHTETVLAQWGMREEVREAGISVVPDCGMGPGLNNTLGVYAIEQLLARRIRPFGVQLWDGGLPQEPTPPWGYSCSFHINGLTNEYDGQALVLRNGAVTKVDALTEPETLTLDGHGEFEAFVTSGGTSTVPYTFEGILEFYENKTLRYPGHYRQFKAFKDLGLFNEEPLTIAAGCSVSPRQLYHSLLGPQLENGRFKDICLMRAQGTGGVEGRRVSVIVELIDRYDEVTDFTAMERLTGWHAAIMAQFIARGEVDAGVQPLETAISATQFVDEVRRRGIAVTERWEESDSAGLYKQPMAVPDDGSTRKG